MRFFSVGVRGSGTRFQNGEPRPTPSPKTTWPRIREPLVPTGGGPSAGGGIGERNQMVTLAASKQWNDAAS